MVSDGKEIGHGAGDEQAMGVLIEAAVADLGEAEHPFDDANDVLDPAAHAAIDAIFPRGAAAGERYDADSMKLVNG